VSELRCPCVKDHVPNTKVLHRHHIVPKAWGGTDTSPALYEGEDGTLGNIVALCPTAHENVHRLLNEHVRRREVPPWKGCLEHYTMAERALVRLAWSWWNDGRGGTSLKPPYTSVKGVATVVLD
jgi:hypothetical protein